MAGVRRSGGRLFVGFYDYSGGGGTLIGGSLLGFATMAGVRRSGGRLIVGFYDYSGVRHTDRRLIVGFYDYGEGSALRRVAHC